MMLNPDVFGDPGAGDNSPRTEMQAALTTGTSNTNAAGTPAHLVNLWHFHLCREIQGVNAPPGERFVECAICGLEMLIPVKLEAHKNGTYEIYSRADFRSFAYTIPKTRFLTSCARRNDEHSGVRIQIKLLGGKPKPKGGDNH